MANLPLGVGFCYQLVDSAPTDKELCDEYKLKMHLTNPTEARNLVALHAHEFSAFLVNPMLKRIIIESYVYESKLKTPITTLLGETV